MMMICPKCRSTMIQPYTGGLHQCMLCSHKAHKIVFEDEAANYHAERAKQKREADSKETTNGHDQ